MSRGDTSLASHEYDMHLASKVKEGNRSAGRELEQRKAERKCAHDSEGRGWHFGLGDKPVKGQFHAGGAERDPVYGRIAAPARQRRGKPHTVLRA